jgi:hypothetical protein
MHGEAGVCERGEHRVSESTFRPVALDGHEPAIRRADGLAERSPVDRLDRIDVEDADAEPMTRRLASSE